MDDKSNLDAGKWDQPERSIFQGELVYLAAPDPERDAGIFARWRRDSEFVRLLDAGPARLFSNEKHKEWMQKDLVEEQKSNVLFFLIRALQDHTTIGVLSLDGIRWVHGDAWVSIGLGEKDYWGKGYGTDAIRVLQRYAFEELNLHRLSLTVFDYNQRALRSYEKAGFVLEGRAREFLNREGQRYDMIFMGILKREWERVHYGDFIT